MVRNRTTTGSLECAVGVPQSNYSRGIAQWLARNVWDLEVGGSNPPPPYGVRSLNLSPTNEDTNRHCLRSKRPSGRPQVQKGREYSSGPQTNWGLSTSEMQPFYSA